MCMLKDELTLRISLSLKLFKQDICRSVNLYVRSYWIPFFAMLTLLKKPYLDSLFGESSFCETTKLFWILRRERDEMFWSARPLRSLDYYRLFLFNLHTLRARILLIIYNQKKCRLCKLLLDRTAQWALVFFPLWIIPNCFELQDELWVSNEASHWAKGWVGRQS
jgi:hypothetical protein